MPYEIPSPRADSSIGKLMVIMNFAPDGQIGTTMWLGSISPSIKAPRGIQQATAVVQAINAPIMLPNSTNAASKTVKRRRFRD